MGLPQLAGVEPVAVDRHERLPDEPLVLAKRLQRRVLPGLVAVEGVDHLATELVLIHEQAPQYADVLHAERRTAGGDRCGHAGEVAGHDIGVALHDDGLPPPGDLPLRDVQAEEHMTLLVDRGLRRIQVLRTVVVLEELAGAESDDVAGDVPDRPQQPPVKPIDQRAP